MRGENLALMEEINSVFQQARLGNVSELSRKMSNS